MNLLCVVLKRRQQRFGFAKKPECCCPSAIFSKSLRARARSGELADGLNRIVLRTFRFLTTGISVAPLSLLTRFSLLAARSFSQIPLTCAAGALATTSGRRLIATLSHRSQRRDEFGRIEFLVTIFVEPFQHHGGHFLWIAGSLPVLALLGGARSTLAGAWFARLGRLCQCFDGQNTHRKHHHQSQTFHFSILSGGEGSDINFDRPEKSGTFLQERTKDRLQDIDRPGFQKKFHVGRLVPKSAYLARIARAARMPLFIAPWILGVSR